MTISPNEKKALNILKAKLSERFGLVDLRVFGSKAKGTAHGHTDLDVLIVLNETNPSIESEIDDLVYELNIEFDCLITPLYFGKEEIETGPMSESPVYKNAVSEGIRW